MAEQARQSAGTIRFVRWGVTPPYREPAKKESALKKAREVIAVGEIIGSNPSPATQKDDGVAAIRPANPFRLPRNYPEIRFACSAPHYHPARHVFSWAGSKSISSICPRGYHNPPTKVVGK